MKHRFFPLLLYVVGLLALGAPSCGEPTVGGSGRLTPPEAEGAGLARLELSGSPYEMGWWQGRRLRDRIRELHPRWQALAFGGGDRGRDLRGLCALYVDQTLRRLPERLRQELDGLADATGLGAGDLLLTEVLRDGLRYHREPLRLKGTLTWDASPPSLSCRASGPDGPILAEDGVLITRRPAGAEEAASTLLAWPGSLGGLAGWSATGLAAVVVEADRPLEEQSLSEVPFTVRLRLALERGRGTSGLIEALGGGTAHRTLVADGRGFTSELPDPAQTGMITFARVGLVAMEVAYVTDTAHATWPERAVDPEGWSPTGVWMGGDGAEADEAETAGGPAWTLRWDDGQWRFRIERGSR